MGGYRQLHSGALFWCCGAGPGGPSTGLPHSPLAADLGPARPHCLPAPPHPSHPPYPPTHAQQVADGYRPPLPADLPRALCDLISACWKGEPTLRPDAAAVVAALEAIQDSGGWGGVGQGLGQGWAGQGQGWAGPGFVEVKGTK